MEESDSLSMWIGFSDLASDAKRGGARHKAQGAR